MLKSVSKDIRRYTLTNTRKFRKLRTDREQLNTHILGAVLMSVSPQVKCTFTLSETRDQRSSQTCGSYSQSSTAVTQCLIIAAYFTDLGMMVVRVKLAYFGTNTHDP